MYEQKLGQYLGTMKEHFDVCKKCEQLEEKISQLTTTAAQDKKAARNYKIAEGKKRRNFFLRKIPEIDWKEEFHAPDLP